VSNLFKRETLSGDFLQVNRHLVAELKALGLWTESMRNRLKQAEGSVQGITELPEELRAVYRTAWELPMAGLIDMAADRGAFIDQSQSLNLFMESPNIGQLSSMYFYAWKKGLKTTYYLRSRPATRIAQTTVGYEEQRTDNRDQMTRESAAAAGPLTAPTGLLSPGERVCVTDAGATEVASPLTPFDGSQRGRGAPEASALPSTPVARPLSLFEIPVFAVDTVVSPSLQAGRGQGEGFTDAEAVACSLENPEYCEACQ
jgi:ribonucleotide reductase alpha subunit